MKRDWDKLKENINVFHGVGESIHQWAVEKGFWEGKQNDSEKIMLMVTELAEAVEALRYGNLPSMHIPSASQSFDTISQVEEKLADCVIRIMDYCAYKNFNLGQAIIEKMKYNETREHKHGKQF